MKQQIKMTLVLLAVLVLVITATLFWKMPETTAPGPEEIKEKKLVGGDSDEYGCIGSAGYTWCQEKNKCLRLWEENCYPDLEQEISFLLGKKYAKKSTELKVSILKKSDTHAAGSVLFSRNGSGEGGLFLAVLLNGVWRIVFDGNGSLDCEKMRVEYKFPKEILQPNFCD